MSDDTVLAQLSALGLDPSARVEAWMELAELLAAMEAIGGRRLQRP